MIGSGFRHHPLWPAILLPPLLLAAVGIPLTALRQEIGIAEREHRQWQDRRRPPQAKPQLPAPIVPGDTGDEAGDEALATYRQLVRRSRFKPNDRLDWTDTLAEIGRRRRLGDTSADIGPPRPLPIATAPREQAADGYRLTVSTMHLETHARHENDVLGALADLEDAIAAHPIIRTCRLRRSEPLPDATPTAYVLADCTIDLIALDKLP